MKKVSVMIVEDSRVVSEFLHYIINRDPRLEVVASVRSGEDAIKSIATVNPDVVSLDIRLPGMNGLEATTRIMSDHPTPIVVVSSDVEDEELKISMNALRAGALAVVQKPVGLSHEDYNKLAESLCTKLVIMSQVRVIRQRYRSRTSAIADEGTSPIRLPKPGLNIPRVLAIVASTGGPSALTKVLGDLTPNFPAPIMLVQHITPGFVRGFVSWLNDVLPHLKVVEAQHQAKLEPGVVYVAPADCHMTYANHHQIYLTHGDAICAQKPSGSALFHSLSKTLGAEAIGVLLTGMGEDGAGGLKEMALAGAYTIAEHESTAVVYGMPAAAVRMGGASAVLPLPEIGPRLNVLFTKRISVP